MTQSERLAMMVGGRATISGGVMAVSISMGADPVAILTTSVRAAPASGAGLAKFREVIAIQGGDPAVCEDLRRLPQAAHTSEVVAGAAGHVTHLGCSAIGHAGMILGAGRETVESRIDPAVGVVLHKKVGDAVAKGESLATVHFNDATHAEEAAAMVRSAMRIGADAPAATKLVRLVIQ
jgi:thymidine phosphorylase